MNDLFAIPSRMTLEENSQAISLCAQKECLSLDINSFFSDPVRKVVTSNTSLLLAVGSEVTTGRKQLILKNTGQGVILIGSSASSKGGFHLDPGQKIEINFTSENSDTIKLYARAYSISSEIEIWEL